MTEQAVLHRPAATDRAARGRQARDALPRDGLADLVIAPDRPTVVTLLQEQARTRVPELVPVRHGRMAVSPFTFFRGSALGMALDIAASPHTGLRVQLCGDAHLSNFGVFASPERRLLFDLNDFDETYPGPWEWDLKRLTASLEIAGRDNGFPPEKRQKIVLAAVRRYRDAMAEFAQSRTLDVWYARADIEELRALMDKKLTDKQRKQVGQGVSRARARDSLKAFAKLAETVDGETRIKSDAPLVVPARDLAPEVGRDELGTWMGALLGVYRETLAPDRRVLLDRFEFVDLARKVVGVGSVGTRCWIVLLRGRDDQDPLFLQVKEAQDSVLAPFVPADLVGDAPVSNQGERVVAGQRLMQAAGDIFLGWERVLGLDGGQRDFYVRQLRDMKGSAEIERMAPASMRMYAALCGWTLARAHARSGDPIAIASYIGEDDVVPQALFEFSTAYADLTEHDHVSLLEAIRDGQLAAENA